MTPSPRGRVLPYERRAYYRTPERAVNAERRPRGAYTLVELLIAVGVIGILASVIIPATRSTELYALESVGDVLAADLRLARSLAMQYNTEWRVTFDASEQAYELEHVGSGNPPVPVNPLAPLNSPPGVYRTEIGSLLHSAGERSVRLVGSATAETNTLVDEVTFGPTGGTGPTRTEDTAIWLMMGTAPDQRFVKLTVSWVTGQVWVDRPQQFKTGTSQLPDSLSPIGQTTRR